MHKVVECSVYLRWLLTEIFLDFPSGNADWDTRQENLTESSSIAGRCGSRAQEQPTVDSSVVVVSLFSRSSNPLPATHRPPHHLLPPTPRVRCVEVGIIKSCQIITSGLSSILKHPISPLLPFRPTSTASNHASGARSGATRSHSRHVVDAY